MHDQPSGLDWRAGDVPVSTRFDDPYFSLENGLEETRHVFLRGNGLPGRFAFDCDNKLAEPAMTPGARGAFSLGRSLCGDSVDSLGSNGWQRA